MKKLAFIFLPLLLIGCGETEETKEENVEEIVETIVEEVETESERKSPRTTLEAENNGVSLKVIYGSPRVKGRKIWGNLVDYNKVWRAGADETTSITFSQNILINGNPIEAGTYAFFILPHENEDWEIILNEEWSKEIHDVWGAYNYKEEKDVLRFDLAPEQVKESQENLTYSFEDDQFIFEWEFVKLTFPITLPEPI